MKLFSVLFLSALTALGQPPVTDSPSDSSAPVAPEISLRSAGLTARSRSTDRTSGVLIKAVQAKNPAQLINPRAPRTYGDGWDNVSWDIITGQARGLKLFAIGF